MELKSKGRFVVDTESDGFLWECTRIWWVVVTDVDTLEVKKYPEGDLSWIKFLEDNAKQIIGSNFIGHDMLVIYKILGYRFPDSIRIVDTMLMSQTQNYKRFPSGKHSLEVWGEFLKQPKIQFDPAKFKNPTPEDLAEMGEYCVGDTITNVKQYLYLLEELRVLTKTNPLLKESTRIEHETAMFVAWAEWYGWKVDKPAAVKLFDDLNKVIKAAEDEIDPLLKVKVKKVDKEPAKPKWIKDGRYAATTVKWFGLKQEDGLLDQPPIEGPYNRIEFIQPDASSMDSIKEHLYSIGWKPDDWNYKKVGREFIKVSPKLSESSLLPLGHFGKLVNDLTTNRSRRDILGGWIEKLDENDRLHGSCFTIATPTGRARHSILVNVPSADAEWGPEIRKLFIASSKTRKIVGADSSGNQFRALCHYLKNDDFTTLVLTGDVHQSNADILSDIIKQVVKRGTAKPFIYAFLFGAGGEKLALILIGKRDAKLGNKAKSEFIKRVPGLEALVKKINDIYDRTEARGSPWVPAADGRRIYCDSRHKALNYVLQSFEAISCKAAVAYQVEKFKEKGWWLTKVFPLIWYHDENEVECDEEIAEEVKQIMIDSYREAGKTFGMMILDGAGKIGNNWYDVH